MPNCITDGGFDGDVVYPGTFNLVKARKEHKCYECGCTINKGDTYEYVSGLCRGEPFTHKTCYPCYCVRNSLIKGGYIYGEIWETIREAMRNDLSRNDYDDFSWLK